ncbi:19808_t:CDS:2 [Dentiscutata erythropus]|uniref:dCMP deaminase n=1 Tax=Dentiscutata erythropus TaxID=1348616 RepID=A0A9N9NDE6_9GLOM|nr:19808_t:CDS:2 [Dentiscutata erythropus]
MLIGITHTVLSNKDDVIKLLKNEFEFKDGKTELTKWNAKPKDEKTELTKWNAKPKDENKSTSKLLLEMVKMNYKTKYVIEVETEEELYEYKQCTLFLLLAVDDALSARYESWMKDNRKKDNNQKESEKKIKVSEFTQKIDNDNKKNHKMMSMADFTVSTDNKPNDELYQEISEILGKPLRSLKEDYFMYLAEVTASRTNCMSRKVGCILVKDDYRVIATGYNGTPTNIGNCIDGRCDCCKGIKEEGRDNCICIHAEENVLLIAGREAEGCTLYCTTRYKDLEKVVELFEEANKKASEKANKAKEEAENKTKDKLEYTVNGEMSLIPHKPQTKRFELYPLKKQAAK